jgi:phage host-nuclease inhibitor protein Gam
MVKAKGPAANVRVPQNREEAAAMIAELGEAQRELELIDTATKAALANVKASAEKEAMPHAEKVKDLYTGLKIFCEANRQTLLGNTGLKTHDFGTGKVSWRFNVARVSFEDEEDEIILRINDKLNAAVERGETGENYKNFLRFKIEVDKDAMRKNADLARSILGVKVGRSGEKFEVEPFAPALAESA